MGRRKLQKPKGRPFRRKEPLPRGLLDQLRAHWIQRQELELQISAAVAGARAQGIAWNDIGAALGVSRQAAQKKYSGIAGGSRGGG